MATKETPKKKADSPAKKALKEVIAKYKEENPTKYEAKKAELDARIKAL